MPDRNVTPSTTDSSQHNRPENGTELLPYRLAEIRARVSDGEPVTLAGPPALVAAFVQKDEDIAWLLDEVQRLTARVRIYEDVKS